MYISMGRARAIRARQERASAVTLNRGLAQVPLMAGGQQRGSWRRGRFREGMGLSDAEVAAFEEYF
jgi:hypothetical protein